MGQSSLRWVHVIEITEIKRMAAELISLLSVSSSVWNRMIGQEQ